MHIHAVDLDPGALDESLQQLAFAFDLDLDELAMARRVLMLFPRATTLYLDELEPETLRALSLSDKFSFDLETDTLTVFERRWDTLIDALIEMAMYLSGFNTLIGSEDPWVVEFAIGAWKPVRKRLKRQLSIPVSDQPRGVIGLPPSAPPKPARPQPDPFRAIVAQYNRVSFEQMVMLAARDEIAVYFPPETHPKVLALYVYMRRAMQEVAEGIDLQDYEQFNLRLLREIGRLEQLFHPATLPLPSGAFPDEEASRNLLAAATPPPEDPPPLPPGNPFEAFIEQLFADDEAE